MSGDPRLVPWRERDEQFARNLAEAIDGLLSTDRPRERRIDLIAVQVMSAIRNGFKRGREYEQWKSGLDQTNTTP